MTYRAPVDEMAFTLNEVVGLKELAGKGAFADFSADLTAAILEEGAKFAADVLAPINWPGDQAGITLRDGAVTMPAGFADAYRQWREGGWGGLAATPDFGGQGLPNALAVAAQEMWNSASLAFGLCPILSQGAIEALTVHGTPELREKFLPKLIEGVWTGTMNLTEPQAGSDLSALKTRAVPAGDGSYRITGTKIYITYGEHDMAENIIHLVLARLPDAPAGTRGISLFLVPKFLVNEDGSLGARNDVTCVGVEEKLGIHASPTCVMAYGEKEGAIGYLIGEENRGLACMFTMMNNARLLVGTQGVAVAERATQHALAYAAERKQGRTPDTDLPAGEMVPIIEHPDVKRMLLTMQAYTQASRAICYANGVALDRAHAGETETEREEGKLRSDLLTPISKGFSTDLGVEIASLGVQVHGGMGFIEETGAAQYYRDARILPIYEGTNGIQAIDLVSRKLPMKNGEVLAAFIAEMRQTAADASASNHAEITPMGTALDTALNAVEEATAYLQDAMKTQPNDALAGAASYLRLIGLAAGGHFLIRGALAAAKDDTAAPPTTIGTARFYCAHLLPQTTGLLMPVMAGAESLDGLKAAS